MSSKADRTAEKIRVVVLASSRSGDKPARPPAFLRPLVGRPAVQYVLDAVRPIDPAGVIVVVGADPESARLSAGITRGYATIVQKEGGASGLFAELKKALAGHGGDLLFVGATLPLVSMELLSELIVQYREKEIPCRSTRQGINEGTKGRTGLFVCDGSLVDDVGRKADPSDALSEDRVFSLLEKGAAQMGGTYDLVPPDLTALVDVSSPRGYAAALGIIRGRIVERLMDNGVIVIDPDRTYVDWDVRVGEGTTLHPDTYLEGKSVIGEGCVIGPNVKIVDSILADEVVIKMCTVIADSEVGRGVQIGPFAHIRPKTRLGRGVKIGNFVEVKKSVIGSGSKANHLSYIGDAVIGKEVNVGAGTITCNYDGVDKHITEIGDGVFIGSDTQFIAPVTVGDHALIGAGSTITKDVPPDALAVSRSKQVNLLGRGVKSKKRRK